MGKVRTFQPNFIAPGGAYFQHQPGDYSVESDNPCSSLTYDGWTSYGSVLTIGTEGNEPWSPPDSLKFTYPIGTVGGSYAGVHTLAGLGNKEVYIGAFLKLSSNWEEHVNGTDSPKLLFVLDDGTGGGGEPFYIRRGDDGKIDGKIQNDDLPHPGPGQRFLNQNIGSVSIDPGEQAHVELIVITNTQGENYDGEFHMWVNNTKVCQYTDVWFSYAATPHWDRVKLNPIWGGLGGELTEAQYLWWDHLRICVKN